MTDWLGTFRNEFAWSPLVLAEVNGCLYVNHATCPDRIVLLPGVFWDQF